ncbi:MAG: magnesium chelatase domain-containing protein, partial [Dehalococcoidia bacterium]
MLARVLSCAVIGLDGDLVEVEVDIGRAMEPRMTVVGLPDAAVQESRERVRAALKNSRFSMPHPSRVTISLSPADLRKEGPAYDLPIAVGMLMAGGHLPEKIEDTVLVGELALSGEL